VFYFNAANTSPKLATLNGHPLYLEQFNQLTDAMSEIDKKTFINSEALTLAIENTGIVNTQLIDLELNEIRKSKIREQFLAHYKPEKISNDALKAYFEQAEHPFKEPKAHVAHILIATHNGMPHKQRENQYKLALETYNKLKAGQSFSALAKTISQDSLTANNAGDLGWLQNGAINQNFSTLIFSKLEPGEYSRPIQTQFGFHIVKLLEPIRSFNANFEDVEGRLKEHMRTHLIEQELARLLASVEIERFDS